MNTPHAPKIRVTVPVSPEVLARFKRLSLVAGQSVGRAMGEWLEETQSGLDPMIEVLEYHKKSPRKAIQALQTYSSALSDSTADLFDHVMRLDKDSEQLAAGGHQRSGAQRLAARKAPQNDQEGGLTPPSSNTGGKGRKTAKKLSGGSN